MKNQTEAAIQHLLTLPETMAAHFGSLEGYSGPDWFATSDPAGARLGSGGGTANLLAAAWRETGAGSTFAEWLRTSRKLIVHGGGHSRRLPAYAAVSKPFIPLPALRGAYGQRFDQTLLKLQLPDYEFVLRASPSNFTTLITSGDVYLRFGHDLPALPDVDVLAFGMPVSPEIAQHFGVFFTSRRQPGALNFFLQKPAAARIRELTAEDHSALVDTGMWLLSERAVMALMAQCGWDEEQQVFASDLPGRYELYAEFGLSLGAQPTTPAPHAVALTAAVVELPRPEFYHLGTSRQLIETVGTLQERDSRRSDMMVMRVYPNQILQNALVARPVRPENHTLWIENAVLGPEWTLAHDHVLTNIPDNEWRLALEPGVCLDMPPIAEDSVCVRGYGIDDRFAGQIGDSATKWFGAPVSEWFACRGLEPERSGVRADMDIQFAPLFPVMAPGELTAEFIRWLTDRSPNPNTAFAEQWLHRPRLSADEISHRLNLRLLLDQQSERRTRALRVLYANRHAAVFYRLDLKATAHLIAADGQPLPPEPHSADITTIARMHDHMWRAVVLRERRVPDWREQEYLAFDCLRTAVVDEVRHEPVVPQRNVVDDQIVWGRAPIRFDLAGGWTDTPPYCLQHGGQVVNVAANLNGQPPIQVFARPSNRPEILLRSIDLGVEQRIHTYSDLESYGQPGSEFSLAKAALVQAGFLPRFYGRTEYRDLQQQLEDFGGGIEISLLAAVPQGSGLGTSSILASTVLGVLSELCALKWDEVELIQRTLALEQMLTTGGGWQDQAGGITRGVKRVATRPGFAQTPVFHWLPEYLFGSEYANRNILLYYTGLTRLAKNILQEIVRGMFLNASDRLGTLQEIGQNAVFVGNAIQRADYGLLCEAVRRSWQLNCRLDADTNPPEVQHILDIAGDYLDAAKLLGAGGGGYVLMFAKDEAAGARIRQQLTDNPPNPRARFSRFSISQTGLEITRS